MDFSYYKKYFSNGNIGRYDIAPIYADSALFKTMVVDIISPFKNIAVDKIVAIDASGFILGTAISQHLKKGLILVRKGGKIPLDYKRKLTTEFTDYTGNLKSLELAIEMIQKGENYLIIDDWIETGSQVKAAINMIEELGGNVVGISTIGADRNELTEELFDKYNLKSIGINV
ncbi:adenine phosphoribosyltransferase [Spirosomataceae bacterium TFI 002]|nr:adenine phosphoribosyltransferase [Spirosomataceae bacterium TFI 002]